MTSCMNAKFVFISLYFLYVYMCLNVSPPPPPTFMRSEPLVVCIEIEIKRTLTLTSLCICLVVHILSHIDLNCRFITFDTRLNTLTVSAKERRHDNLDYCLLVLSYFSIFEFYFVVFLPLNLQADFDIRMITKVATQFKTYHMAIISSTSRSCIHIAYITIACIYQFVHRSKFDPDYVGANSLYAGYV